MEQQTRETGTSTKEQSSDDLWSVVRLAGRLGATSFGGPAAHISMLRLETVERRKWLDDRAFLDLLGMTNLIPGPNSTEMVMHIGHLRAGRSGMVAAGAAFILPAALITLGFAWLYVEYGTTPTGEELLWGIKPAILAVIGHAVWALGRSAVKGASDGLALITVGVLYLLGVNELLLLLGGALLIAGITVARDRRSGMTALSVSPWSLSAALPALLTTAADVPYTATRLFFTFVKIGSVLYGSGYVLIAFLRSDFVVGYGWLTEQQLLDAVAVGQVTPGPVFTTATFIGYLIGGWWGAFLATAGIFLPAFVFVGLTHPLLHRLTERPLTSALLTAVSLTALGLMGAVGIVLGRDALIDPWTVAIFAIALLTLIRWKVNATWLIAFGAASGLARLLLA